MNGFIHFSKLLELDLIFFCVMLLFAYDFLELCDFDILEIVVVLKLQILLLQEKVSATGIIQLFAENHYFLL